MSAKHPKKSGKSSGPSSKPATSPAIAAATAPSIQGAAATTAVDPTTPWTESPDPRKRMLGKVVLAGVWIYVAALWLLALDQTFNWGIFGPKLPPM